MMWSNETRGQNLFAAKIAHRRVRFYGALPAQNRFAPLPERAPLSGSRNHKGNTALATYFSSCLRIFKNSARRSGVVADAYSEAV